jgi:hypothetical protein
MISSIGISNSTIVTFTLLIKTRKELILSRVAPVHAPTIVPQAQTLFRIQDKWVVEALSILVSYNMHHCHCTKFRE